MKRQRTLADILAPAPAAMMDPEGRAPYRTYRSTMGAKRMMPAAVDGVRVCWGRGGARMSHSTTIQEHRRREGGDLHTHTQGK